MYKIGVMLMGKSSQSPKKVKQIILQVQGKTKMSNIAEYLQELGKITHRNVQFSLEKNGMPINDVSNITQASKYAVPVNGVIKLYMYEREENGRLEGSRDDLKEQVGLRVEKVGRGVQESGQTVDTAQVVNPTPTPVNSSPLPQPQPSTLQQKPQKKGCCCL